MEQSSSVVQAMAAAMGKPEAWAQDVVQRALQGETSAWWSLQDDFGVTIGAVARAGDLRPALFACLESMFGGATSSTAHP